MPNLQGNTTPIADGSDLLRFSNNSEYISINRSSHDDFNYIPYLVFSGGCEPNSLGHKYFKTAKNISVSNEEIIFDQLWFGMYTSIHVTVGFTSDQCTEFCIQVFLLNQVCYRKLYDNALVLSSSNNDCNEGYKKELTSNHSTNDFVIGSLPPDYYYLVLQPRIREAKIDANWEFNATYSYYNHTNNNYTTVCNVTGRNGPPCKIYPSGTDDCFFIETHPQMDPSGSILFYYYDVVVASHVKNELNTLSKWFLVVGLVLLFASIVLIIIIFVHIIIRRICRKPSSQATEQ